MNKKFALHTLSLAIVIASGSVKADTPTDCVTDNGTGETMKEWGIWCGVETFLTTLTEQDPTAAGPAETDVDIALSEVGRGDAEEFDPNAENTASPEPQPLDPHITLNEEGQGYVVSYDMEFPDTNGYGSAVFLRSSAPSQAVNPRVGTLSLNLSDNCDECKYSEGASDPDTASYVLFNQLGEEVERDDYEGYTEEETPNGSRYRGTDVYIDDDSIHFYLHQYHRQMTEDNGQEQTSESYFNAAGHSLPLFLNGESKEGYYRDFLTGYFGADNNLYTSGPTPNTDAFDSTVERSGLQRSFVYGMFTPEAELNQLSAGDVTAIYGGYTSFFSQQVQLTVDFGNATFDGSFGDAGDLRLRSRGNRLYREQLGMPEDFDFSFTTSGVIQGTELISTEISTGQGFVQGSFFEPNAQLIGGAYQVTKAGFEFADVFATAKGYAPPHIEKPYFHTDFVGYQAGFDFQGDNVDEYDVSAFGLSVYNEPDSTYESFNGYAGSSGFNEYNGDDFGTCNNTDSCDQTRVSVSENENQGSDFSHLDQSTNQEQQNRWDGYEASTDDGTDSEVLKDYWNGYHKMSNSNDEGSDPTNSERYFVAGVITPLIEIQSLISDQRTLVYSGNSQNLLQSTRVEVDFGNQHFEAQFGDVDAGKKSQLGISATKDMSFNAAGVVSGSNIISTSVSAEAGFLQGTFFGAEAKVLGGAYDVTVGGDRIVDVFSATQGAANTIGRPDPL